MYTNHETALSAYYRRLMKRVIYASLALLLSGEQGTTSDTKLVSKNTAPYKANATMKLQEFWRVIDYAKQQADGDEGAQEKLLVETLAQYSPDEIIEFECLLRQCLEEADDFGVMAAEKIIDGSVTDDSYIYFRCWLVAQGKKVFTEVVHNPDSLADVPSVGAFVEFEPLLYVATEAYKIRTGKQEEDASFPRDKATERGLSYDSGSETKGADWTPEQLPALLPKLWAKYN